MVQGIAYISRATLIPRADEVRSTWKLASLTGPSNALKATLGKPSPLIHFFYHNALETMAEVGDHNARVRWWLEFLTASKDALEYRKGNVNGIAEFLSG